MEIADLALSIDEQDFVGSLEKARKSLEPESQLMLDLSSIRRIDSRGLRALQELVHQAEESKGKVVLRGVNVDVYKALKLARLTRIFSFVS
jgi:anti-anti-sigma factor